MGKCKEIQKSVNETRSKILILKTEKENLETKKQTIQTNHIEDKVNETQTKIDENQNQLIKKQKEYNDDCILQNNTTSTKCKEIQKSVNETRSKLLILKTEKENLETKKQTIQTNHIEDKVNET